MTTVLTSPEQVTEFLQGIQQEFVTIDFSPALRVELDAMADMESGFFGAQTGPDGVAWPALKPATIKRKGHSIRLIDTGALSVSLGERGTPPNGIREVIKTENGGEAILGTYLPYSQFHTAQTDQREHIGFTDVYLDAATNRVADFTLDQFAKGA